MEFFGLPASGKTTTAKKLQKDYGYQIIIVDNNKELLFYNLIFFIKNPFFCMITFYYIVKYSLSWKIFYYKLMNCYFQSNAKYIKAAGKERVIIDQGHWQNLLSIFDKRINIKTIERYIKFLPKSGKVVMFRINDREWDDRISKRGYFARESIIIDDNNWRSTIKENYDILFDFLQENFESQVVFFNSSKNNLEMLNE